MTTEDDVRRWVDSYMRAWGSNDPADIEALFTEDARYYTAPYREPWSGRQSIIEQWLDRKDEPGDWKYRFEIMSVCGRLGFVRGWTSYENSNYSNLWVIDLAEDGRCREFTEWWMKEK